MYSQYTLDLPGGKSKNRTKALSRRENARAFADGKIVTGASSCDVDLYRTGFDRTKIANLERLTV